MCGRTRPGSGPPRRSCRPQRFSGGSAAQIRDRRADSLDSKGADGNARPGRTVTWLPGPLMLRLDRHWFAAVLLLFAGVARADTYYVVVFGAQSDPPRAKYSHSWATFVRLTRAGAA